MKKRMILVMGISLLLGTAVFGAGLITPPTTINVKVTCNPALPDGTPVQVLIGGERCNCPHPSVTGTASGGTATVSIGLGECIPNEHCIAYASASFGTPSKVYKGQEKIVKGIRTHVKMAE